eukprot:TRINITY_DN22085_c0_g2_i1.p1 TRINITY_DN22085_c0_g2~~TRINITY_DN22085_c0_g2_i1.p1  ORF type:complete len:426 (+),score=55.26 TRINITY_DN22085_c0_g2_i1:86-1363(+)
MVRLWQLIREDELPSNLVGHFILAIAELLEIENERNEEAKCSEQDERTSRGELGRLRRRFRNLLLQMESMAKEVSDTLRRLSAEVLAGRKLELPSLVVAWDVSAAGLAEIYDSGALGGQLQLRKNVAGLRAGWQLCGALARDVADVPGAEPVQAESDLAVVADRLMRLARHLVPTRLVIRIPLLDVITLQMRALDDCRARYNDEQLDAQEEEREKAQLFLAKSTLREREKLEATSGLDASDADVALLPAHLERRISWDKYRSAEHLVETYRRRAARTSSFGQRHRPRSAAAHGRSRLRSQQGSLPYQRPSPVQPALLPRAPPVQPALLRSYASSPTLECMRPRLVTDAMPLSPCAAMQPSPCAGMQRSPLFTVQPEQAFIAAALAEQPQQAWNDGDYSPFTLPPRGQFAYDAATADIARRLRNLH